MNSNLNAENVIVRLKQILSEKSDQKLGDYLGIPKSTISNWRQRDSVPYSICVQIAQDKNVSLDWLLTGEGEMLKNSAPALPIADPQAQKVVSLFMKMDAAARNRAVNALEDIYDLATLRHSRQNELRQSV